MNTGTILRLKTGGDARIYYRVVAINNSACSIVPLFRLKKEHLTIRFKQPNPSSVYLSDLNTSYEVAENSEIADIVRILKQFSGLSLQNK